MKYILPLSLVLLLLAEACKKPQDDTPKTFKIVESGTNNPIEGARVEGYKCLKADLGVDCLQEVFVSATNTDASGVASFPASSEVSVIAVSKDRYWSTRNSFPLFSDSKTSLLPVATLKVHIVKENTYEASKHLFVMNQAGKCYDCQIEYKDINQPKDTVIYLNGVGNNFNSVVYAMTSPIMDSTKTSKIVEINRFDTVLFEIRY